MVRILFVFLFLFGLFFFGIKALRDMTGKQKWELTKLIIYSTICAVVSLATMIALVLIF